MTVYFAANEFEAFVIAGGWSFSTTTGFDATICRGSMQINNVTSNGTLTGTLSASATELWLAFYWAQTFTAGPYNAAGVLVQIQDATGKPFLRIIGPSAGAVPTFTFQKSTNGSTWTTVGSTFTGAQSTLYRLAIHARINSSGLFEAYVDTNLLGSSSEDTTVYAASAASFVFARNATIGGGNCSSFFSQVIAADADCRGWKLKTIFPSGAGSNAGWTGLFSDINSDAVPADTTINTTTATGVKQSYAVTDVGANQYSAYAVMAVVTSTRAEVASGGPQHIDHLIRRGSTDYLSSDLAPPTSFGPVLTVWATDPSTGAPWNLTSFTGAIEYGFASAA